jgi:hypothetical protein
MIAADRDRERVGIVVHDERRRLPLRRRHHFGDASMDAVTDVGRFYRQVAAVGDARVSRQGLNEPATTQRRRRETRDVAGHAQRGRESHELRAHAILRPGA